MKGGMDRIQIVSPNMKYLVVRFPGTWPFRRNLENKSPVNSHKVIFMEVVLQSEDRREKDSMEVFPVD